MSDSPSVAVVILNWNSRDLVARSLRSLEQSTYRNTRVILVDNGSVDASTAELVTEFPWLDSVMSLPINRGFTGGVNAGLRLAEQSAADYYFLLTGLVAPDAITHLVRTAESDPRIGALNPKIFYLHEPGLICHARGHFNWWLGLTRSHAKKPPRLPERTEDVNFLTGSAMFIRSATVRDVGLMDERFFMYFEDLDYTRRIEKSGYRVLYEPNSEVWHAVQGSVGRNTRRGTPIRFINRNRLLLMRKHASAIQWLTFLPALVLWHVLAHVAVYALRRQWEDVAAIFAGSLDYLRMGVD